MQKKTVNQDFKFVLQNGNQDISRWENNKADHNIEKSLSVIHGVIESVRFEQKSSMSLRMHSIINAVNYAKNGTQKQLRSKFSILQELCENNRTIIFNSFHTETVNKKNKRNVNIVKIHHD